MEHLPRPDASIPGPWRYAQVLLLIIGIAIIALLILRPKIGLVGLWDVLIPAAPALLVFAPGLWRNICPLGIVSQAPRTFGMGRQRRLGPAAHGGVALGAVLLLLILVPLRHVGLDDFGWVSAGTLIAAGVLALAAGLLLSGKSGWCSGLCPVAPVEQLYGRRPALTLRNAHCATCIRCTARCPDSTPGMSPLTASPTRLHSAAGILIVGGFPGFVWGWYQVPTAPPFDAARWAETFAWTWGGLAATLTVFLILRAAAARAFLLEAGFAAAAVSIYYWYKLPGLLGLEARGTALLHLGDALPHWSVWALRAGIIAVFFGWLTGPGARSAARPWLRRPAFKLDQTPAPPARGSFAFVHLSQSASRSG